MRRFLAASLLLMSTSLGVATPDARAADPTSGPDRAERAGENIAARAAAAERRIKLRRWSDGDHWRQGAFDGVRVYRGRVVFAEPAGQRRYDDRLYDVARWTSPWVEPGFSFTELIASWSAATPRDSWIEVAVRGERGDGTRTSYDVLGRWAAGDRHVERRSVSGQSDDGTSVNVDTWRAGGLSRYQLRITLHRRTGTTAKPTVDLATGMVSRLPAAAGPTSAPGVAGGTVLAVPRYSQMVHRGHYPQWGNGGEAWCSPTSTSMVLGYYDALPPARRYAWVPDGHVDPWVDYAARRTFDHAYDGTGNWPFNTAYAAPLAGEAFVTRLRSLREAERFIAAGIPLVVSIAFGSGELDNAPISSSNGHLLVIAGFRENGNVVVNDPAASTRQGVRRTYKRGQLERLWLEASGGLVYVVRDADHPLPFPGKHSNW